MGEVKSEFDFMKYHLRPYQQPHPPIGIAGLSPDSELSVEYLVEKSWFVGSTSTVIDKLGQLQHDTGGFGGLLVMM